MIAVKQEITELIYSNIPDIVALWDSSTTYTIGDYARIGNYVYRSTSTLNINKSPEIQANLVAYWVLWGVSNAHAAFDLLEDTLTTWEDTGTFTFARGSKEVIGIGRYIADTVTIEYLDASDNVLDTETITTFNSPQAYDLWLYMYAPFIDVQVTVIYRTLKKIGVNIRVTFDNNGSPTSCGYCVAGRVIDFGRTLDKVSFSDRDIGSQTASVATFTTIVDKTLLVDAINTGKAMKKIPAMFVIDPLENSSHKNLVIIGKINKCDGIAENMGLNTISFEIEQNIEV